MNVIGDFLGGRQNLAEERDFPRSQSATATWDALPAAVEADELPHGIQTAAARHDRIAFEMAAKDPEVRIDIQLGDQFALAVLATPLADMNDAIDHQHVRCG